MRPPWCPRRPGGEAGHGVPRLLLPQVQQDLGLAVDEADLFSAIAPAPLREEFVAALTEGAKLALAVNTEKAKSEFIIAPVLLELRRWLGGSFGLFSGVELVS